MYKKSEKLKLIRENLAKGAGLYNACKSSGIDYGTVWGWRNKFKRIDNYFNKILTQRVQLVEDALYKSALEGNTTAQIFFLKNRGKGWNDSKFDQLQINNIHKEIKVVINDITTDASPRVSPTHETGDSLSRS